MMKKLVIGIVLLLLGMAPFPQGRMGLRGKASRFHALIGVQDNPTGGTVEFMVAGDGKVLFRSGIMRDHEKAKEIDVDLTGMQKLTLQITDGGDGITADHADWIEPALIPLGPH